MYRSFSLHPMARAALTSCTVMTAGDALCQYIRSKKDHRINLDQSLRFSLIGLTLHGPYFYNAFKWIDRTFGQGTTLKTALTKSLAGQVTVFPVYLVGFFFYMGLLEGRDVPECIEKVKQAGPTTFLTGSAFWPAANIVNFMYVPSTKRVLFVNAAGLFWNAFLSFENSTRGDVPHKTT